MTACQRSLPRSPRSNKYSQEYAGRVVSRQSGTRRRSVIRLFHGATRYNQVFHAIDSLASLSLSPSPVSGIMPFLPSFPRQILVVNPSYPFIIIISSRLVSFETIQRSARNRNNRNARNCAERTDLGEPRIDEEIR